MEQDPESRGRLIREARKARKLSQTELGDRVGTSQQQIGKIEKGTLNHSRFLRKIATELGLDQRVVEPEDSTSSTASIIPEADLRSRTAYFPVHAAAEGGPGELIVSSDPVQWVLRPNPLVGISRAYGLYVVGDSMEPVYRSGEIVLINPLSPPQRDETFIFYAENERLGEAKATIKHLVKWTSTHWHVHQWNPPKGQKHDFTLPRDVWGKAHMVVGKYRT